MATLSKSAPSLRISPADLKDRLEAGEAATILDTRNPQAWQSSDVKIRGATRVDAHDFHVDPNWPKDRLTVVY
jgi:rhodanese-related sulfurtransferase